MSTLYKLIRVLSFITIILTNIRSQKIKNLSSNNGNQWFVKDSTGEYNNLQAIVPGGIYSDLMRNKTIGDILYGYNDTETRWVANKNWTYNTQFTVDDEILRQDNINLVFEGLDTFSSIFLNNKQVGRSENMFVQYIFDVKNVVQVGNNQLEVKFISPIKVAEDLAYQKNYSIPPNCPSNEYRGECHVNQIRKMQASFSWDWGPAFPSMGIWKDVYLESFNSSVIRYVTVAINESTTSPDSWCVKISTYLDPGKNGTITGNLVHTIQTDVSQIQEIVNVNHTSSSNADVLVEFSLTIPKLIVRKWWPNGYGDQKLYQLSTDFFSGSSNTEKSSHAIKIGFRKVELIEDVLESGLSFYFKVNNVPIFAKGSNEIPLDILPERGHNPEIITRILQSAHAANMNMIRVWGGGVYESDFFYNTADELGILIWQDFMFACAMYPSDPEFLQNVKLEVRHQVRRLNYHPSIALWAGNNENEVALVTNWYGTKNNFSLYKNDFIKLYVETIKAELYRNVERQVIFLTSSPTNGKESVREGYLAAKPQSPLFGDVHYYNYLFNSLNINTYPVPRFASEFGYQSLPDVDTWLTVTDNLEDLVPSSPFMDHRQHHLLGLIQNNLLMGYQLKVNTSSQNYYRTYIYYLQIVQALSIKFEVELYRSYMGRLDGQGKGNTMGALFWQLNDVWVAPTWSGIDYTGKWKMLQYFATKFFAQTLITGYLNTERQLQIYVVSEVVSLIDSPLYVTADISVYNWRHVQPINSTQIPVTMVYGKSAQVTVINTDDFLSSLGCGTLLTARNNCFFHLTLKIGNIVLAPTNFVLAGVLKESNFVAARVAISSVAQIDKDGKKFEITIGSSGIAMFVWLDSHEIRGRFSENGFIQVEAQKNVTLESVNVVTIAQLKRILTVTHLKDTQHQ